MPSALAFLPWISITEPITIGPLRLLPYQRGKLPGDLPKITQADIDGVLSAYANRPGNNIAKATIFELGEWQSGMDADNVVSDLFRARTALAFSALAHRQLFRQSSNYCNYDTYSLVVQRYTAGETGAFAFTTRCRDGGTSHLWSSDEFSFHRPNHVDLHSHLSLDEPLLAFVLSLSGSDPLLEAIKEFNYANTDSPDVPEHVELVMMKSAFEWLLAIGEKADEFVAGINECLKGMHAVESLNGPLKAQWQKARPSASRPLEAWAREFCALRGAAAHGKSRAVSHFVWHIRAHLAFASLFFPLLFKKVAADRGIFKIDDYDVEKLRLIDAYLLSDPFKFDRVAGDSIHPWPEIDIRALCSARAPLFYSEKQEK
jgi:hypothetical protein